MADGQRRGGKKGRKIGRAARKPKTAKYKNANMRAKNKTKRVLKSNGVGAARDYAKSHGTQEFLNKIINK